MEICEENTEVLTEVVYKNDYTKKEDEILWELHEIRYKLHKDFKNQSLEEINTNALRKYRNWQRQK